MQRIEVTGKESIEVKRFNFPLVIKVSCPKCKTVCSHNFNHDYLSYPQLNTPERIDIHCKECDEYFEAKVTLRLAIEFDETSVKPQE